jgi:cytochrome c peroxidase
MKIISIFILGLGVLVTQMAFAHGPYSVSLQRVPVPPVEGTLNNQPVNLLPENGSDPIITDKAKAIALGKALFWDVNVGSDGMACGSCHFRAGADGRIKNQINPGAKSSLPLGQTFQPTFTGLGGPNYTLKLSDFPTHRFTNVLDKNSGVTFTTDDVVSSGGTFSGEFQGAPKFTGKDDQCDRNGVDSQFHVGPLNTRRVEPRNAPTVINAVFNHRLFWDGRANNVFNGSSNWGDRDPNAGVWVKLNGRTAAKQKLRLINSALASLSVAPPLSDTEMGCRQRRLADIGRKILLRQPLQNQKVHNEDSVLGAYSLSTPGNLKPGMNTLYRDLIRDAFNQKFWSYTGASQFGGPAGQMPYNQMEANFPLFFGLALQMYQATLVSDQSPFDLSRRSGNTGLPIDLPANARTGFSLFTNNHCATCHGGPTNSIAAIATNAALLTPTIDPNTGLPKTFGPLISPIEYGPNSMGNPLLVGGAADIGMNRYVNVVGRDGIQGEGIQGVRALLDFGFVNTGVGNPDADPGVGGVDDFGNPLSFVKQYKQYLLDNPTGVKDQVIKTVRSCQFILSLANNDNVDTLDNFSNVQGIIPDGSKEEATAPGSITERSQNCPDPASAYIPSPAALQAIAGTDPRWRDSTKAAFKVPTLRNIELTGPYMHNGSMATLEQVFDFYTRKGNFTNPDLHGNLPQVTLNQNAANRANMLAFFKSLTDERVRYERAPFDHPEIAVPHGHDGNEVAANSGNPLGTLQAKDEFLVVPAVGANGAANPLLPFDALLPP